MNLIVIFLVLVFFSCSSTSQTTIDNKVEYSKNNDTLSMEKQDIDKLLPRLKIKEGSIFNIPGGENRFIEKEITILNNGGSELIIQNVRASCSCSSGKVIQGKVMPMSTGKVILSVNKDGLDNGVGSIEFLIDSNSIDSPHSVRIIVE